MPEDSKLTTASDEQLVRNTLAGDISTFGTIVERYWNMAVALALSKVNDPTEAEDIAQESFIKAYSQLNSLRSPSCFAGWLSKIIHQQCVNHIRKQTRNKIVSSCEFAAVNASDLASTCSKNPGLSAEQTHFVRQTVSRLPERFQKLIIMRFVAGLSTPQIAKQLGKSHGAVRVHLHRAYKILEKELSPLLEEAK